jgi:hypothetical protein
MPYTQSLDVQKPDGKDETSDVVIVVRGGRRLRLPQIIHVQQPQVVLNPKPNTKNPNGQQAMPQTIDAKLPVGKTGGMQILTKDLSGKQAGIMYVPSVVAAILSYLFPTYHGFDWDLEVPLSSWLALDGGALKWKPVSQTPADMYYTTPRGMYAASGGFIYYQVWTGGASWDGGVASADIWRTSLDGTVDEYAFTLPSLALSIDPGNWYLFSAQADAENTYWMTFTQRATTVAQGPFHFAPVYDVYKVPNATLVPAQFCEPMYEANDIAPDNYSIEPGWINAVPQHTGSNYGLTVNDTGVFVSANRMKKSRYASGSLEIWYNEILYAPVGGTSWTVYVLNTETEVSPYGLSWHDYYTGGLYDSASLSGFLATDTDVFFTWLREWKDLTPPYTHSETSYRSWNPTDGMSVLDAASDSKSLVWARGAELLYYTLSGGDLLFYYTNDNCLSFTLVATITDVPWNPVFIHSGRALTDVYFFDTNLNISGASKLSGGVLTAGLSITA